MQAQGDNQPEDAAAAAPKPTRIKISTKATTEETDKKLHPSFNNPTRVVEKPPFELSECGSEAFFAQSAESSCCGCAPAPIEDPYERERGDTKDHPLRLSQWFLNFSEADELLKLAAARQQVQAHIVKLRRQLSVMDGLPQQSQPPAGGYEWQ